MRAHLLALFLAAPLGACIMGSGGPAGGAATPGATAMLADATGAPRGTVRFTQTDAGIAVAIDARGLPPGVHGVHVHATGTCDAPGFATAGGHWNPTIMKHGSAAPGGPHAGDMPNLTVAADSTAHLDVTLPAARLKDGAMPLLDADGAAVIVHAGPDDYLTDPAGNSGARIACGVVTPA